MVAGAFAKGLPQETGGARLVSHAPGTGRVAIAALAAAGLLLDVVGCGGPPETRKSAAAAPAAKEGGTRRMAERLDEITRGLDPRQNIFVNAARAALLKATIEQKPAQSASAPILHMPAAREKRP